MSSSGSTSSSSSNSNSSISSVSTFSDVSSNAEPTPPITSKTNAFFSSAFANIPPPAPKRTVVTTDNSSRTSSRNSNNSWRTRSRSPTPKPTRDFLYIDLDRGSNDGNLNAFTPFSPSTSNSGFNYDLTTSPISPSCSSNQQESEEEEALTTPKPPHSFPSSIPRRPDLTRHDSLLPTPIATSLLSHKASLLKLVSQPGDVPLGEYEEPKAGSIISLSGVEGLPAESSFSSGPTSSGLPSSAVSSLRIPDQSLPSGLPTESSFSTSTSTSSSALSTSSSASSLRIPDNGIQTAGDLTLKLISPLGQGAFSNVWLAEDRSLLGLEHVALRKSASIKRTSSLKRSGSGSIKRSGSGRSGSGSIKRSGSTGGSLKRKSRNNRDSPRATTPIPGTRPQFLPPLKGLGIGLVAGGGKERERTKSVYLDERDGDGYGGSVGVSVSQMDITEVTNGETGQTKLVAVKMTPRSPNDEDGGRTRVSFVREVEVLRHISHPNITQLLASVTTPTHHVLVLPYLPGGDLLGLVNSDEMFAALTESTLRRIWCELCKAVGWMHGVGLVHRDVKLENILLTTPFLSLPSELPQSPLIKLTDFGLSRFIDPTSPLLSTRCGSEAYAAPELVISGRKYDGRETDAWACGVVLYALVGRRLPFGEGVSGGGGQGRIVGEREGGAGGGGGVTERRSWLMRIARGAYEWPESPAVPGEIFDERDGELKGSRLVRSQGVKRIVGKLLVRDSGKRAKIGELWDDEWMYGPDEEGGEGQEVVVLLESSPMASPVQVDILDRLYHDHAEEAEEERNLEEEESDDDEEGWLVDEESIPGIACQEVQ